MEKLLIRLKRDHPQLTFHPSTSLCWSPESNKILYASNSPKTALAGLLHEVGHARLHHAGYTYDQELLQKEVDAWEEALLLARHYNVPINHDHIQDCIDTYRDWAYKRSLCPMCNLTGLQMTETSFQCINCTHSWTVTSARLHRPYRRRSKSNTGAS